MSLGARLWAYQAERFPLQKTVPLLAVFSAASVNVSALLAGRSLPGWGAYGVAFVLALGLFFQMRVADEWKDLEDDRRFRPERPIPRGLVSLRLIVALGLVSSVLCVLVAATAGVLWLLALVWAWLALMTVEFFAPLWLKARPVLYLLTHMAIMPLIDLMLTGVEWAGRGGPAPMLWTFLALSFLNGCVLEIGRKTWAPEAERVGVETYSRLWGPGRAAWLFAALVVAAALVLAVLGAALGHLVAFALIGAAGAGAALWLARGFARRPDARGQARIDMAAGLWVLVCYGAAGFLPVLL